MKTTHQIHFKNSNNMEEVPSESVNLVVTSPPYPMIEMWDELFSSMNPEIETALSNEDGMKAYYLMNEELNKVWKEVDRVMVYGGIVAINIGDATRKIGNTFQLYANHSRITNCFEKMGYQVLPAIIWRKQTNKPNKFMGSGMLPPNAYVTLEHEYILIFRKSNNRNFSNDQKIIRRKSAYFWEERNIWFSDIWTDLKGISQKLNKKNLRERNAAYPFELVYRLINMYSVQGDVVLDPFLGTGTTTMAAACLARNSIGYEIDPNFKEVIKPRFQETLKFSEEIVLDRIRDHLDFVAEREEEKGKLKHISKNYGFSVVTSQEKNILFQIMRDYKIINENEFNVYYEEHSHDYGSDSELNIDETYKKKEKQRKLI
ncbi:MAG: site-specific DNA-methyltransferase [Candidatus Methanofastidiosa archaeon]|nr:site-specific DNA-methyltransferase [Candidatus Methanofastidiosa archaeon]